MIALKWTALAAAACIAVSLTSSVALRPRRRSGESELYAKPDIEPVFVSFRQRQQWFRRPQQLPGVRPARVGAEPTQCPARHGDQPIATAIEPGAHFDRLGHDGFCRPYSSDGRSGHVYELFALLHRC